LNLAHLSDLHLGHCAFDRAVQGRNVRERDVAEAFHRAVEALVAIGPDLVLIAGDVFDRHDPSPSALVALTRGLEVLGAELPDTPVLMISGARDTPRRSDDPGALAALESFPRVETATTAARSISLRDGTVHVVMMPHPAILRRETPAPEPDRGARWNVLLAYGRVTSGRSPRSVRVSSEGWDYVALGSDHAARAISTGIHYSGALERVGPVPWTEAAEEKGFLTHDLVEGRTTFQRIPGRPVVALAPIRARPGDGEGLRARVREVTEEVPGGIDDKIVHMTFRGIEPTDLIALQGDLLAALRSRALHLSLEIEAGAPPSETRAADLRSGLKEILEASGGPTEEQQELLERLLPPEPLPWAPA
jgi:DNA repair exonuclease SbcCD nuclease subunit